MPTIVVVAGTRPEVIKMAPVFRALRRCASLKTLFLSTGQHREMLSQACSVFSITPDYDFSVMQPAQGLSELTGRLLTHATAWLKEYRPDAILVQGDTTTVLALALAGFYERIPVGHVEAGLRTYNYDAPWPEEMNRRLTDPICRWCFAPTSSSRENLLAERISSERIHVTGNTVIDALLYVRDEVIGKVDSSIMVRNLGVDADFARRYFDEAKPGESGAGNLMLVTGHRRESFGSGFEEICRAILTLVERNVQLGVVYPVHLNPNVQEPVRRILGGHPRIQLVPPASYEAFIWLMNKASIVLTDSGGVQEEAPSLGKPVLVMRDTTERPEGVKAGTCQLVGTQSDSIVAHTEQLLRNPLEYARRSMLRNPYGDGRAAERIAGIIEASYAQ